MRRQLRWHELHSTCCWGIEKPPNERREIAVSIDVTSRTKHDFATAVRDGGYCHRPQLASFENLLRSVLFGAVGELPFEPGDDVSPGTKRHFANCRSCGRACSPQALGDSCDETSVSAKPFQSMRSLYRFDGAPGRILTRLANQIDAT
jgi:hypothetical protein